MWPGLHLDLRDHVATDHTGHDAGEGVARAGRRRTVRIAGEGITPHLFVAADDVDWGTRIRPSGACTVTFGTPVAPTTRISANAAPGLNVTGIPAADVRAVRRSVARALPLSFTAR